ncbi:MAG TPA: hypothetical protein VFE25_13015 [Opitutaceae bacterium]|jgi:hypothetical protein|nr:hypothetical protein [Opitutaceae bacterium]
MKAPSVLKFFDHLLDKVTRQGGELGVIERRNHGSFSVRELDASWGFGEFPTIEGAAEIARLNGLIPAVDESARFDPENPDGALKYVVLAEQGCMDLIVFCVPPMTHKELAIAHATPTRKVVGAGYVTFQGRDAYAFGSSSTLDAVPRERDSRLLTALYRVTANMNRPPQPPAA